MPAFAGPVPFWCRAGMTKYDTVSYGGEGKLRFVLGWLKRPLKQLDYLLFRNRSGVHLGGSRSNRVASHLDHHPLKFLFLNPQIPQLRNLDVRT